MIQLPSDGAMCSAAADIQRTGYWRTSEMAGRYTGGPAAEHGPLAAYLAELGLRAEPNGAG